MPYKQELIKPYSQQGDKGRQIGDMFDNIAPVYDNLTHLFSLGLDRLWRRKALATLRPLAPRKVLDVSTGTGDFAFLAHRMLAPESIVGADISEGMMSLARQKAQRRGLGEAISFETADCMSLPYASGEFDAVTVAFGVRNYPDLDLCLREMRRVLRPSGRLLIVELSSPKGKALSALFRLYTHTVLPLLGRLVGRDGKAYAYLGASVEAFPQAEEMAAILRKNGYAEVAWKRLCLGVCTIYNASPWGKQP